jgi:hypothetical protein
MFFKQLRSLSCVASFLVSGAAFAAQPCGLSGSIESRIASCATNNNGFALVTRATTGKEIWMKLSQGLLWGDALPGTYTQDEAKAACRKTSPDTDYPAETMFGSWRLADTSDFENAYPTELANVVPNMQGIQWTSSSSSPGMGGWVFDFSKNKKKLVSEKEKYPAHCVAYVKKIACGATGSLENRMADCSTHQSAIEKSSRVFTVSIGNDQVDSSDEPKSIYQDARTGLVWAAHTRILANQADAAKACQDYFAGDTALSSLRWRIPSLYEMQQTLSVGNPAAMSRYGQWTTEIDPKYENFGVLFYSTHGFGDYRSRGGADREKKETARHVTCVADTRATCGTVGSIADRVRDCSRFGKLVQNANYELVTITNENSYIYRDKTSGVIWSDLLPGSLNQNEAMQACATLPQAPAEMKVSGWRLPTVQEFETASKNDFISLAPNMNYAFWTSSLYNNSSAWYFDGFTNQSSNKRRDSNCLTNQSECDFKGYAYEMHGRCVADPL